MADIFGSDTIQDNDDTAITLDTLVGEGRKYKSPDELAKAYNHADATIETLKAAQAAKDAEIKVLRDIAEARQNSKPTNEDGTPRNEPPAAAPAPKSEVDISQLVREELTNASEEKRKADNINSAAEQMNRLYGSPAKAQEAIRTRANELGVSFDWLRDVASDSPQAFFASMGVTPGQRSQGTPAFQNEVNLSRTSGVKGFKHFEDLRKQSPKLYYSRDIQDQMFAARKELADKFFTS